MLSDDTPFPHQGPLAPDRVRGRDDLVADLVERVTGRRMTALLGPRRFGKTTVLGAVATTLEQAGTSVIRLDLYETRSAADLVVRLDRALAAGRGGIRGRLSSLAVASSVNLGVLKLEFSRPPSQRPDADASLDLLLDLLVEAAAQEPTLLVIDEFTGINGVAGAAGLLRTKLQHHVQEIGVLFAGSEPSAMAAMFTEQSQPFYAQADLVEIHPFSLAQLTDIVDGGFTSTGRRSDGWPGWCTMPLPAIPTARCSSPTPHGSGRSPAARERQRGPRLGGRCNAASHPGSRCFSAPSRTPNRSCSARSPPAARCSGARWSCSAHRPAPCRPRGTASSETAHSPATSPSWTRC
jgi:hypothetical protein